jgi:ABC-2 type transport system ATP-binding protein
MAAIELSGLRKEFGDVTALRGLDLTVEEGEIYGFLGPNGAGKSTTINVLLDFIRPSSGEARVFGADAHDDSLSVRERVGTLPDQFSLYDRLTGRQHVEFAIESKGTGEDPMDLLDRVGIADAADRKAGGYSSGMGQRLALAMALVGDPDLLVLDEPSTGLDPNGAREMRQIIQEERDRGATVFFSSHILEQVEAVSDRVGILREGQMVAEDTVAGLREAVGGGATLSVTVDEVTDGAVAAAEAVDGVSEVRADGTSLTVTCESDAKRAVLDALEESGVTVRDFATEERSLEDLFVAYTEGER